MSLCNDSQTYLSMSALREVFKDVFAQERQEGWQEGRQEGTEKANKRVAMDMLKEKLPLQLITKISKLSEDVVRNLAASMGLSV